MTGNQEDYQRAKEWQKNKDAMNDIRYQIAQLKQQYQELEYSCKQAVRYFRNRMANIDILEVNTITHDTDTFIDNRYQFVITNNNNKINMKTIELF